MSGIVVGSDGSDVSRHAVEWAAREAEMRGDPLRIVHALQGWLFGSAGDKPAAEVGRQAREDAKNLLSEAADQARQAAPEAEVTTEIVSGDARPALIEAAEGAVMLVVGGRGEGGFTGLLLGSVAHGVVGHTRCAAVVVQGAPGAPVGQIVAGVDASPSSAAALEFAFSEAANRQATLRAIYARPARDSGATIHGTRLDEDEGRKQLSDTIAPVAERFSAVKVVEELAEGHPVGVLARASAEADLLVVGQRGRGGFTRLVLGSVSRGVLHHAACPVMVVPG